MEGTILINSGIVVTQKWAYRTVLAFDNGRFWLRIMVYMYKIGYCLFCNYFKTPVWLQCNSIIILSLFGISVEFKVQENSIINNIGLN